MGSQVPQHMDQNHVVFREEEDLSGQPGAFKTTLKVFLADVSHH